MMPEQAKLVALVVVYGCVLFYLLKIVFGAEARAQSRKYMAAITPKRRYSRRCLGHLNEQPRERLAVLVDGAKCDRCQK